MSDVQPKKGHPILKCFIILLIIGACIFGIAKCLHSQNSKEKSNIGSTTQDNQSIEKKHFHRSANNSDITYAMDMDLSSFGEKYTITPNVDIDGLTVILQFLDKDKRVLDTAVKQLGNVKEGVQVSFSISLLDIGLSVAWNTRYSSMVVTGGTVSYFA